jgi:hypothetical protein
LKKLLTKKGLNLSKDLYFVMMTRIVMKRRELISKEKENALILALVQALLSKVGKFIPLKPLQSGIKTF